MPLESIHNLTEEDLALLIKERIPESKHLDYKERLPFKHGDGRSKQDVADSIFKFLELVSSFANSDGGVILFGMSERDADVPGCAGRLSPITDETYDEAIRRLSQLIEVGISPRVAFDAARLSVGSEDTTGYVLAMRVPKSLSWPHMATYGGRSGFYVRSEAKASRMDAHDVRAAVLASEEVVDRIRMTTSSRLDALAAGKHPIAMTSNSLLVIQAVSLEAFSRGILNTQLPSGPQLLDKCWKAFFRLGTSRSGVRHNLDGVLAYHASGVAGRGVLQYIQVCRSGLIEMAWSGVLSDGSCGGGMPLSDPDSPKIIVAQVVEPYIVNIMEHLHSLLTDIGFTGPASFAISLLNCNGCSLLHLRERARSAIADSSPAQLAEPRIHFPDFELDTFQQYDFPKLLKPVFDMLWNAAGSERSPSYDADGNWIGAPSAGS